MARATLALLLVVAAAAAPEFDADGKCKATCPKDSGSSCLTECATKMHECWDIHNHTTVPDKYEGCTKKVLEKFAKFVPPVGSLFLKKASQTDAREECTGACPKDAGTQCATECEVKMHECWDVHNVTIPEGKAKYDGCTKAVLAKFAKFVPPSGLVFLKHRVGDLPDHHHECTDACMHTGNSTCNTDCETKVYRCWGTFNNTVPEEKKLYEDCTEKVLEKFRSAQAASEKHDQPKNTTALVAPRSFRKAVAKHL